MQRSGTTICARMIQWDIEAPYCCWVGGNLKRVNSSEHEPLGTPLVYHAPGVAHLLHQVSSPDTAVIWMKRDPEEILQSARNKEWIPTVELKIYKDRFPKDEELYYNTIIRGLTKAKNEVWEEQKPRIENTFEIEYESLRSHPLWLDNRPFNKRSRAISPGTAPKSEPIPGGVQYQTNISALSDLLEEFPKDK